MGAVRPARVRAGRSAGELTVLLAALVGSWEQVKEREANVAAREGEAERRHAEATELIAMAEGRARSRVSCAAPPPFPAPLCLCEGVQGIVGREPGELVICEGQSDAHRDVHVVPHLPHSCGCRHGTENTVRTIICPACQRSTLDETTAEL